MARLIVGLGDWWEEKKRIYSFYIAVIFFQFYDSILLEQIKQINRVLKLESTIITFPLTLLSFNFIYWITIFLESMLDKWCTKTYVHFSFSILYVLFPFNVFNFSFMSRIKKWFRNLAAAKKKEEKKKEEPVNGVRDRKCFRFLSFISCVFLRLLEEVSRVNCVHCRICEWLVSIITSVSQLFPLQYLWCMLIGS